jgi:hypothetical protein
MVTGQPLSTDVITTAVIVIAQFLKWYGNKKLGPE